MRKENVVTLQDRGRVLTFKIREMPALQTAEWVERAIMALGASGLPVPEGAGVSYLADMIQNDAGATLVISSLVKAKHEDVKPLLMEMLGCASLIIGKMEVRMTEESVSDHIEDWVTIERLRIEAIKLNLGFSMGAGGDASGSQESVSGGRA